MTWGSLLEGFANIAAFALPAALLVWADQAPRPHKEVPARPAPPKCH
jgi:hypothetical protein